MLISAPGAPGAADVPGAPPTPADATASRGPGTTICWPSVSTDATLSTDSTAFSRGPPASSIASITREPAGNSYTPGRRTCPVTSTNTDTPAVADGAETPDAIGA